MFFAPRLASGYHWRVGSLQSYFCRFSAVSVEKPGCCSKRLAVMGVPIMGVT